MNLSAVAGYWLMVDYGKKSILIVHEESVSRWAIKSLAQQKWPGVRVMEARNSDEGLALAKAENLSVILIRAANMPVVTSEIVRSLVDAAAGAPVVVLGGSQTADEVIAAVDAGAHAYISQFSDARVLELVVSVVLGGGFCFPSTLETSPHPERRRQSEPPSHRAGDVAPRQGERAIGMGLTERQLAVARLVARGFSNKEIANRLGILDGTVKAHLRAVAGALGVRNRTQIALAVIQRGLLDDIGSSDGATGSPRE